jgi:creatinine amidohydrolase
VSRAQEERLLPIAFPNLARKPWASRLTEEFRSGACHAGRFEGSIVLAVRPELVRDTVRRTLAPNPASLSTAIRSGAATFEEAGGPRAYFGWPADATAEEGRATVETLGEILAEAVRLGLAQGSEA